MNLNDQGGVVDCTFNPPFKPYLHHSKIPGLGSRSRSRSEPGVFGSLEPEPEPLEKKNQKKILPIWLPSPAKYCSIPNRTVPTNLDELERSRRRRRPYLQTTIQTVPTPFQNTVLFQTAPFQKTLMNLNDHVVVVDRTIKPPFKPYLHHSKILLYSKPHHSNKP